MKRSLGQETRSTRSAFRYAVPGEAPRHDTIMPTDARTFPGSLARLCDVWLQRDLGAPSTGFRAAVPRHGVVRLRLFPTDTFTQH